MGWSNRKYWPFRPPRHSWSRNDRIYRELWRYRTQRGYGMDGRNWMRRSYVKWMHRSEWSHRPKFDASRADGQYWKHGTQRRHRFHGSIWTARVYWSYGAEGGSRYSRRHRGRPRRHAGTIWKHRIHRKHRAH